MSSTLNESTNHFKSGVWQQQYKYKSFVPNLINREWLITDGQLNALLSQANIKLGQLDAYSTLVPDVDFFIQMHITKEATKSSRIEGTQTNIEEVFQKPENLEPEKRNDRREVRNYIDAMNSSITKLAELPLSGRLLKNAHHVLMQGVRGEHKQPGEFRRSQNWIGGSSINDAVFIPPPTEEVANLMSDLDKLLNNENISVPDLVKIGIAHYQFETIHPFLDGNGRIGRLMITLYLVSKGILVKPTLYLSDFFEKNKTLYYDNLMRCRTHNDLNQWLKFFLEGVRQTAENAIQTFKKIIELREKYERKATSTLGKKIPKAHELLHFLYSHPVIDTGDATKVLHVGTTTAHRLIEDFMRLGILKEITGYKRNRIFLFEEYINLFE